MRPEKRTTLKRCCGRRKFGVLQFWKISPTLSAMGLRRASIFVLCAWMLGWSGIGVGRMTNQAHLWGHDLCPTFAHSHHGGKAHHHSHDPSKKDHEPLPFDGFTATAAPVSASPTALAPSLGDTAVSLAGFDSISIDPSLQWRSSVDDTGPPNVDVPLTASPSNRAPPLA
jgi:hypothetical protein